MNDIFYEVLAARTGVMMIHDARIWRQYHIHNIQRDWWYAFIVLWKILEGQYSKVFAYFLSLSPHNHSIYLFRPIQAIQVVQSKTPTVIIAHHENTRPCHPQTFFRLHLRRPRLWIRSTRTYLPAIRSLPPSSMPRLSQIIQSPTKSIRPLWQVTRQCSCQISRDQIESR